VILLDTHVLIWWANGDRQRLSATALAAIDAAIESAGQPGGAPGLLVSAISFDVERWLALLASHRRCDCWPWIPPWPWQPPACPGRSTLIPPTAFW
jgi:hypothetical protein